MKNQIIILAFFNFIIANQSAIAVVSQDPLLYRAVNVKPNIALVLDTSGSMAWDCVYAKQVIDAFIKEGSPLSGLTEGCLPNTDIRHLSPVNNKLFYNPMVTYGPGYTGGVLNAPAVVDKTSIVTVYLPIPPKDPTTYTTSAAIKNAANYNKYDVTATKFLKDGIATTSNANPFGTHGGIRKDCITAGIVNDPCTFSQERQNIANWRAKHTTRIDAAKAGLSGAFSSQSDNFRLAYGDINGAPNVMQDFSVAKSNFYSWIDARTPNGSTPLRTALNSVGQYYSNSANSGPWGSNPASPPSGETSASHLSCRRSYALLITDGFYNDAAPTGIGDVDSTKGTKYTYALDATKSYQYIPGDASDIRNRGKSDTTTGSGGTAGTLADIALKYWSTDLRTDLANDSGKGAASDPPFWQNMTSYMVSFGALGSMTDAAVKSAKSGALAWAIPVTNERTTIDDMRHAAHNGGGDFLTVTDADQFSNDLGNVIGSISAQQVSQAGVAASAVNLVAGTKKFVPYYTAGSWWGNLKMVDLSATGASAGDVWQVISTDGNGQPTGTTTFPTPTTRKIVVWVDSTSQSVDFNMVNVTAGSNNLRGTNTNMQLSNAVNSDVIDFLRGVRTLEGNGMRKRQAILGDIVNSTPVFIKNNTNPQYEKLPSTTPGLSTYDAYIKSKAARSEGVLFVGSNDGMLHAFAEGSGTKIGGREVFAYIPRSVLGKLEQLASPSYVGNHKFMVDGPLSEADAYVTVPNVASGTSTKWSNLVIGTTGAGAKAVFAINATDPLGLGNKSVLWEINADPSFPLMSGNTNTSFAELGNVLTPVQTGITVSGDWVSIFGNGYDSKSGKASLFIVESGSGKLLKQIDTDGMVGNGLGGVRLVLNSKQQIIGAYAGDLKGRVWKFDLSGSSSSFWGLGNQGSALFTAMSGAVPLPITAQPAVAERTDQPGYVPSYLISVGAGKLFESSDPTATTPTQAVYGLWDRKSFGSSGSDSIADTQLELLKINQQASVPGVGTITDPSTYYSVNYASSATAQIDWASKRGWKLPLDVLPGQRVVYPVQMTGEIVKIDTIAPDGNTASCKASASNAINFYINPLTGICRTGGTFDMNGDGIIDQRDDGVCAYSSLADGMDVILNVLDPTGNDTNIVNIQGSDSNRMVRNGGPRPQPPTCADPVYASTHTSLCNTNCTDATYAAAHTSECTTPGSIMNRSWRQFFPRVN
jgi:type IV pilus assembly protein PilY1